MKRRQARELALQALFQVDNNEISVEDAIGHVTEEQDGISYSTSKGNN